MSYQNIVGRILDNVISEINKEEETRLVRSHDDKHGIGSEDLGSEESCEGASYFEFF